MSKNKIKHLLEIVSKLRDPISGCPWDQKQTFQSIIPHAVEEVYEVADSINNGDMISLKDELGDLLFQVVFLSHLASELGHFSFYDVIDGISEKMTRRHPHVFEAIASNKKQEANMSWESIKTRERAEINKSSSNTLDESVLANIVKSLPSIIRAHKLQKRAATTGFDWESYQNVFEKIDEEIVEIKHEIAKKSNNERILDEIGDLIFSCINLARKLGVNAEAALEKANLKFEKRFRLLENKARSEELELKDLDLEALDELWNQIKTQESLDTD